jgi:uncharacterized membrane protein
MKTMPPTRITTPEGGSDPLVSRTDEIQEDSEGGEKRTRLIWVDFLRGIAIMLMIPANLSPYYAEPHAMWYRFMSSLAAPMFISLSAGMVILNSEKHHFGYYLTRGAAVMLIGALLDTLLWRILPFASVDVLYVIGFSIPLIYWVRAQKLGVLIALGGIFMLGGPLLQTFAGYNEKILEIKLIGFYLPDVSRIVASWFVDGYFPLFPWLGYGFMGGALFKCVSQAENRSNVIWLLVVGVILLGVGSLLLFVPTSIIHNLANGGILVSREGYSEIFYPPTYGFLFFSNGIVFIQIAVFSRMRYSVLSGIPIFFGKHSMLVYILHQALGECGLKPVLAWVGAERVTDAYTFLVINIFMFMIVAAMCKMADLVKKAHPPRKVFLQIILGK